MKQLLFVSMMSMLISSSLLAEELTLDFSSYLGGDGDDYALAIAVDSNRSAVVVGYTASTNYPVSNAIQSNYVGGASDIFVTRFASNVPTVVYSTYLGGSGEEEAHIVEFCPDGSLWLAGTTDSTNFPTTNAYQEALAGGTDAFLMKLAPGGTSIVYSTYLGGSADDDASSICLASNGDLLLVGTTDSTNFPVTNAVQADSAGGIDSFALRIASNGTELVYSTYLGGSGANDIAEGAALDSWDRLYIAGHTDSSDFPTSAPLQIAHSGGTYDVFVSCLASNGSNLVYSTYLGGSSSDRGMDIAVDAQGAAYVTGYTRSTNFPTRAAFMTEFVGPTSRDAAFVSKLAPGGTYLDYSTYLAGTGYDFGYAIAVDEVGQATVAGRTASLDFPTYIPYQANRAGSPSIPFYDAFVAKLSLSGGELLYSTYLGGAKSESGIQLDTHTINRAYIVGETRSTDLPITNAFQSAFGGGYTDAFVSEFQLFEDLRIVHISTSDGNVRVDWTGDNDTTQRLMRADSLAPPLWNPVSTAYPSQGPLRTYFTPLDDSEQGFYRVDGY